MKENYELYYVDNIEDDSIDMLIGNGFTAAFETINFSYEDFSLEIINSEEFQATLSEIKLDNFARDYISKLDDKNIEKYLMELIKLLKFYRGESEKKETSKIINDLNEQLNTKFIEVINQEVKYKPNEINPMIRNIFSTNYVSDMQKNFSKSLPMNMINNKTKGLYTPECDKDDVSTCLECRLNKSHECHSRFEQFVYYLHGGINIYYKMDVFGNKEYKYISKWDEVEDELKGYKPLLITAGTGKDKYDMIQEHYYLKTAYKIFENGTDSVLVYGNSLSEVDSHLVKSLNKRLKENKEAKIYIVLYIGENESKVSKMSEQLDKFDEEVVDRVKFIESEKAKTLISNK